MSKHLEQFKRDYSFWLLAAGFVLFYLVPARDQIVTAVVLLAAVCLHSYKLWGSRSTAIYIISVMLPGYCVEYIGTHSSFIFGSYHYNPANNIGLIYGVPIIAPVVYTILVYTASFVVIGISKKFLVRRNCWILSLMTGVLIMIKEMASDPLQAMVSQRIIWDRGGEWFNVPLHNYIGQFVVFSIIAFIATTYAWHKPKLASKAQIDNRTLLLPVLLFATMMFFVLTSAIAVSNHFQSLSHVSIFILIFLLSPWLLLSYFFGFKRD